MTEPPIAKAAWWTYVLQKTEHTGRRSQRGQCEDEYQHHGDHTWHHGTYNQHHLPNQYQPCPCRLTTYSSSSQGSGNSSSSILFNLNREPAVSWHLAFAAEAETLTPQGPRATSKISNPALRKTDRPQSKSRLKVHLRHLANMGPSENATRPSLLRS